MAIGSLSERIWQKAVTLPNDCLDHRCNSFYFLLIYTVNALEPGIDVGNLCP